MREVYKVDMDHYLYLISNKPGPFPLSEYSYLLENQIDTNRLRSIAPDSVMLSITTVPYIRPKPKYQVLYTDWEGSRIPDFYRKSVSIADLIVVPSEFARSAFWSGGINREVVVVPHGIDPTLFPIQNPSGKFTFLCIAADDWRKGLDILVDAFTSEFRPDEANLRVRTSADLDKYRNVIVDRSKVPFSQMGSMYNAHAFVLPTRGEGFCMPALEALASGLPVIITEYGGHIEFLCNDYFPVEIETFINRPDQGIPDYDIIEYAEPSVTSLREQMRYVYDNWDSARRRTLRGTHRVRRNYTWSNTLSILDDYLTYSEI